MVRAIHKRGASPSRWSNKQLLAKSTDSWLGCFALRVTSLTPPCISKTRMTLLQTQAHRKERAGRYRTALRLAARQNRG